MSLIYKASFQDFSVFHSIDQTPRQSDFNMHIHGENEIYLFAAGNAAYLVEGNEYPLNEGSVLIMRRSESHAVKILGDAPYERYVINFSDSFVNSIDPEHRLLEPFYNRSLGTANLYEADLFSGTKAIAYFEQMCREDGDCYEKRLRAATNLFSLLQDISYSQKKRMEINTDRSETSYKIIDYVNRHLFEELSVPIIANHFYMSPSQLERVFKKATRSSIWQYISAKRLAAAQSKIEEGSSAYTACEECGFGDYSAFYRAYVKKYGVPPNTSKQK